MCMMCAGQRRRLSLWPWLTCACIGEMFGPKPGWCVCMCGQRQCAVRPAGVRCVRVPACRLLLSLSGAQGGQKAEVVIWSLFRLLARDPPARAFPGLGRHFLCTTDLIGTATGQSKRHALSSRPLHFSLFFFLLVHCISSRYIAH